MEKDPEKLFLLNKIFEFYYLDRAKDLKYYVTRDAWKNKYPLLDLEKIVLNLDSTFVLRFALYINQKLNLTIQSILLIILLIKKGDLNKDLDIVIDKIIRKPEQIKEFLLVYKIVNNIPNLKKISNILKRNIVISLNKFEYEYFNKNNEEISFKDIILLTHPKPINKKMDVIFKEILDEKLEKQVTWSSKYYKLSKGELKNSFILREILELDIPYNDILRNIRNFISFINSEEDLQLLLNKILDIDKIIDSNSFIMAFVDIYSCLRYKKLEYLEKILSSISRALEESFNYIDLFKYDKVLICVDTSEMSYYIEEQLKYLIPLMSLINKNSENSITGFLTDNYEIFKGSGNNIFIEKNDIKKFIPEKRYKRDLNKIFEYALNSELVFDKFIIFTGDIKESSAIKTWDKYKTSINPNAELVIFNSYSGITEFREDNITLLESYSDKIFYSLQDILDFKNTIDLI